MIYDIAILGGGPAGYSAAFEAVKNRLTVILFEKDKLGGTCLNRGCIPTKFLVHTSDIYSKAQNSARYGITTEGCSLNYKTTVSEMNSVIGRLRDGLAEQLLDGKVEIVKGSAELLENKTISCNGNDYFAKNIIIATGSSPAKPLIEEAHTSDDALRLDHVPKNVKIIGGGVIAIEFANIFKNLGAEVTICVRGDRILRKLDKELAISVTQNLKKDGIKIKTKCTMDEFKEGVYEYILSACGRIPRTEALDKCNIALDEKGAVITDENGKTNIDDIYAAGDVVSGSVMLAHTAMEQGRRIVHHILGEKCSSPSVFSNCIYINPEVASVGITETQAKYSEIDFVSAKVNMMSNSMTLIHSDKRSFIRVIADKPTHKLIGAQLMCERASDISSEFVVAIKNGLTVENILESLHPHPSFSEAIYDVMVSLKNKIDEV